MIIPPKYFVVIILCLCIKVLQAQNNQAAANDSIRNFKISALPVLFYLPETGLGYGGLGIGTFRFKDEASESRPSTVQIALTFTSKKQLLLFAPFELYADDEKWRFVGEFGYYDYFYNFFGIGIESNLENLETYEVRFPRVRLGILRELFDDFSIGLSYEFDSFSKPKLLENGILDTSELLGKAGGTISNLGITAVFDSRDNIFFPTKGFFIQGNVFTSVNLLGATYSYNKVLLDLSWYQKLNGRQIVATNVFIANNGKGTPFLDLNYLGSRRSRGFDNRRYQDNAELSLALEYRFPIYKRFEGVVYTSSGTVAPSINRVFSSSFRSALGGGLRYTINRREGTRIRVDYGRTNEGGNFYFTIKEAF